MAAAPSVTTGLSAVDIQGIREALAAGRKPKVVFTSAAGQMAGQSGQVVELTDPAGGDDFVVVRFGRDELPFSPADVAIAPRGTRKAQPGKVPADRPPVAEPEFVLDRPAPPAPRPVADRKESPSMPPVDSTAGAEVPPAEVVRPRRAAKAAKPKGPAGLTVTVSYQGGEWTVAAHQGSKALAKPYLIKPAEALKMVALLDVPGVQEAVEQIIAAERSQAQEHAQRLRAELAEIEAKLAELT